MKDPVFGELTKYQVLPLDASAATRLVAVRRSVSAVRKVFTYSAPVTGLPDSVAPRLLNTPYTITADIDVPQGGEGSIVSEGGWFGGYGMYLFKGKPVFTWNLLGLQRVRWESPQALSPGKRAIVFDLEDDGLGFSTLSLHIAGRLNKLTTSIEPPVLTDEDKKQIGGFVPRRTGRELIGARQA